MKHNLCACDILDACAWATTLRNRAIKNNPINTALVLFIFFIYILDFRVEDWIAERVSVYLDE